MANHPYLLESFEFGPTAIGRLVRVIPKAKWDVALAEDRFTVREIVAHLADCDPIFLDRMRQAVAKPGVEVKGFEPDERATEQGYSKTDVMEQLDLWSVRRNEAAEFVNSLDPEQMKSYYQHASWGDMTVQDQVVMMVGHDMYHVDQLTQYLEEKTAATW